MSQEKVTLASLGTKMQHHFDAFRTNRAEAARLRAVANWHDHQAAEAKKRFQQAKAEFLAEASKLDEPGDSVTEPDTVRAIHVRDDSTGETT